MSFRLFLVSDHVEVEAGGSMPLAFELVNQGEESEMYEITVEGLDPEWFAIPNPTPRLDPGESQREGVLLKPPRTNESVAGDYPFLVHVRSLSTGESKEVPASLSIKPFHSISLTASPKKGLVTPSKRVAEFRVTALNLGNGEHELQLFGTDTDDEVEFNFSQERITVGPGQEKSVVLTATPNRRPLLANSRLYGLSITARSVTTPSVSSTTSAQIEQRAVASPGAFAAILLVLALIGGWILSFPKPPLLEELILSQNRIQLGNTVRIDWRASNAKKVELIIDGEPKPQLALVGALEFKPTQARTYEIEAYALDGRNRSPLVKRTLTVDAPPEVPVPRILAFDAQQDTVNVGGKVRLEYSINDAVVRLTLFPNNLVLDPRVRSNMIEVPAEIEGPITYRLVAENSAGSLDTRETTVTVEKRSGAKIVVFRATETEVEPEGGSVRLSWTVTEAIRVELLVNKAIQEFPPESSGTELSVTEETTLVLRAFDRQGLLVESKPIRIKLKKPPEPTPEDPAEGTPDQNQPLDPAPEKPPGARG